MAAGDLTTTYTHTRGRLIRHTLIKSVIECNGTTTVNGNLDSTQIPLGVYGGFIQGRVDNRAGANNINVNIKTGLETVGSTNDFTVYATGTLAVDADPFYIAARGFFRDVDAPEVENYLGQIALPTSELNIWTNTSSAAEDDGQTITLWIALLSHILEV